MAELALFFSAFVAATILPFSSEVAFMTALKSGMPLSHAMLAASSGNILAIVFNYYLGYFLYEKTKRKLFGSKIGKRAFLWGHKYGYITLFASWLPIIGDPLTIVAGLVRLKFVWFVIIAGLLRIGRYYLLATFL
ncbi:MULTISPECIES: YqaA family protein [Sulfurimonas]|uniref:YqaA family protein n=1 Tax=Sulfurimonas TaxID=202746 RepID=UPI001FE9FDB0|nr:YqaA family protein [Sulfurimonas indica]